MSTKNSISAKNEAAKSLLTFFYIVFFVPFLLLTSCRKETNLEAQYHQDGPMFALSNPTVINGMLHFDEYSDLEDFIYTLQQQEMDTTSVKNAYAFFGIDLTLEELPNFTDHPVCLKKELEIANFSSARKQEEEAINTVLNNGLDTFSIVADPYFKTALNQFYAVHIGNRIFKYYDNGGIAIIINDDWDLYNTIKSSDFTALPTHHNLIITGLSRNNWSSFFVLGSDKSVGGEIPLYQLLFISDTVNEQIYVLNNSVVESDLGNQTYKWLYSDSTTSSGRDPDRAFSLADTFKLVIENGKGIKDTLDQNAILRCSIPESSISIVNLNNGQIRFEFPHKYHASLTLKWTFGDGSTSTQNPVIKSLPGSGVVLLQILRADGTEYCSGTKPYIVTCGEQKRIDQTLQRNINGQTWRIEAALWVKPGEVGCSMKYLRRRLGIWMAASNDGVCTDFSGSYNRRLPDNTCSTVFASGTRCLGRGTYPTSISVIRYDQTDIFRIPELLTSGHEVDVNGTWFGFGVDGVPRLVLD